MRSWLMALSFLLATSPSNAATDADILNLVALARSQALTIGVDGADDWGPIPRFSDPVEGNDGLDIIEYAVAPLEDELLVLVQTAMTPTGTDGAFKLTFDLLGGPRRDIEIELNPVSGVHVLEVFDDLDMSLGTQNLGAGLVLAFGSGHLEVSVPYSSFDTLLPAAMQTALEPANHRPFVRMGVETFSGASEVDRVSAGSYRLIASPFLDPPSPVPSPPEAVPVEWPLAGEWLLAQGGFSYFTHASCWCYDLVRIDHEGDTAEPPGSVLNGDYYAFGEPLFAPAAGTVTMMTRHNFDDVTPGTPGPGMEYNLVQIDMTENLFTNLLHIEQFSLETTSGAMVDARSQPLARIGNSGFTVESHLHLEVTDGTPGPTLPLTFDHVVVALNPGGSDPWAREVQNWELRESFLISHAAIHDDFDDGEDTTPTRWTHFDPPVANPAPSFPAGGYQIEANADPTFGIPGNAASYVAHAGFEDFAAAANIVDFDAGVEQAIGLGARALDIETTTPKGYLAAIISSAATDLLLIGRMDGGAANVTTLAVSSDPITLSVANDYRLVFTGVGPDFSAWLFQLPDLSVPIATVFASDATYQRSGPVTMFVANNAAPGFNGTADATFDDFHASAHTEDTDLDTIPDAVELVNGSDPLTPFYGVSALPPAALGLLALLAAISGAAFSRRRPGVG